MEDSYRDLIKGTSAAMIMPLRHIRSGMFLLVFDNWSDAL